jgi:Tol biopolymer transport system component
LQHPNILPLHDSGEADGFLYYVMPYVEGESLRDKLAKEGELPIGEAVRILRDVVDALTEAHAHGVVHRDIKPENILLRGRHALVTDFGVAKAVSEATGREKLTTAGIALGTPAYMAPEQASADPHLDQRVDIYAVGAVAYELLTGRPVFMGTTPQMILSAHMTEPPQPVTKHRDTVPAALESVVMRCLEKRPADRWQSAEELLPQLEALATPSGGVTPTDTMPVKAIAGRRWLVPGVAVAAVVLVMTGVLFSRVFAPSPITITTSNIRAVTSEPGVEWQPALSPDGSQVAFEVFRDGSRSIVIRSTASIAGSEGLNPTRSPEGTQEYFPAWSPDGEFVRFLACRGDRGCSWSEVAKLGGSIRPIDLPENATSFSNVAWSPDNSRVAFVAWPDSLFTYSIDDRTTTLLAVVPALNGGLHSPVWSPNGRRIAFVNGNSPWIQSFNVDVSSICIVDANGGMPVRVTGEDFMYTSPAWLDENHLLFISNRDGLREVYVIDVGPTGPRGEPQKVPGATDAHSISYSIDGRRLAFSKATARQNIWASRIGSGPVSIRDGHPVTSENAIIENHDVSPGGEWIVYHSTVRGNADIFKKRVAGGSTISIADSPVDEGVPRWSPDGTEIAFVRRDGGGGLEVMVVDADGGTPLQVASGLSTWIVCWSPSGLEIVYPSDRTGRKEAWIVSRDSVGGSWGAATQLTDFGCVPEDWGPDGSGVLCLLPWPEEAMVLVSREGEVFWRFDLATAGLARWGLPFPRFSRDGSVIYLAASHENGSRGIWGIPLSGGLPILVVESAESWAPDFFSEGPDQFYVTIAEHESDIWVMDVEVER